MTATAKRNPPLVIFGNPPKYPEGKRPSESEAWDFVRQIAAMWKMTAQSAQGAHYLRAIKKGLDVDMQREASELLELATRMQGNVRMGIHTNPGRVKMADHVQAVVYIHAKDRTARVHGFGDANLNEDALKRGRLELGDLHDLTDVAMYGNADGTVTLCGTKGQRLWRNFPDER